MLQGKTILVVDDDINLCQMVQIALEQAGARAYFATDGRDGLQKFYEHRPDLVILDILMPEMNGWEVCQQIRTLSNTPIVMLTTLREDKDLVRALDSGADDFVTKPFTMKVLLARTRAVLRRSTNAETEEKPTLYRDHYLTIDLKRRRVLVAEEQVPLTATEFELLSLLFQHAGQVLTYQQILEKIWGHEYRDSVDYVHVYLSHLRRKLEPDSREPVYLITEHGVGYRFEPQHSPE